MRGRAGLGTLYALDAFHIYLLELAEKLLAEKIGCVVTPIFYAKELDDVLYMSPIMFTR